MHLAEFKRAGLSAVAALALSCQSPYASEQSQPVSLAIVVDVSAAPTISSVVVQVEAPDITTPLVFDLEINNGVASGSISVPAGSNRLLTVTAFDAAGIGTHRGSTTITVREGNNPTVTLTIVVTIRSLIVSVIPTVDTLMIGQTLVLKATVLDQNGDTLAVSARWATVNPARATVDTAGIVTAVGAGDVQIVATYAGVGASTALHIQH